MAGPKTPAPKAPDVLANDLSYCLVAMTGPKAIAAAYVKDMGTGKPVKELDFTGAKATPTTVTGAGDAPNRNFMIDVAERMCTVDGKKMNMYTEDGPSRIKGDRMIPDPVSPVLAPSGPAR